MDALTLSAFSVPFWTAVAALAAVGTACVTSYYTYLTLRMLRNQAEPKVILYVAQNEHRPFVLMLVVENIGKDVAYDIRFAPSRALPEHAYGLSPETAKSPKAMKDGPIINGIAALEPGGKRILSWGQYGGLTKALGKECVEVVVLFRHGRRSLKSFALLDVQSFCCVTASDQPIKKISNQLEEISRYIRRIDDHLDPLIVKPFEEENEDETIG